MSSRNRLAAVAFFAFAASALAALSPEKAKWGEGPAQFLMTKDEAAQWKTLQSDAAADAFMLGFWARRGGASAKADQEGRWKYADEKFSVGKTPGSMTDRGKALALFGVPNKVLKGGGQGASTITGPRTGSPQHITDAYMESQGDAGADSRNQAVQVWVYEGDLAQKIFGVPKVELRFADRFNNNEFKMETPRIDFAAARERAIKAMIVRQEQQLVPPPPAPPGVKTAAYAAAVADARSGKAALSKGALLTAADFVSPSGDSYTPVMLYVPKSAGLAADAADTLFWTVDDASGKSIAVGEEPAKLTASNGDFYVDRSVKVPAAGKYTVTMGLGKAGAPVVVVSDALDFNPIAKDASGTSRLILSDNIYELAEAAPEKAPFAFGKLKIVPKADGVFTNKDDLNYFVEINNPGIDTVTNLPKLQMGIDLISKGETVSRLPLSEAAVSSLSGKPGPGHYMISDAIPLSQLSKPLPAGDYTLKMKIVDTVTKQSYTLEQPFKIRG